MSNSENPVTPPPTPADGAETTDVKRTDNEVKPIETMNNSKRLEMAVSSIELPDEHKKVLLKLKELQEEHLRCEEQYRQEWNALKLKYLAKFKPLYAARRDALTKTEEEIREGTQNLPNFWVKAMRNHLLLSEMIEEHDLPILSHLEDIVFEWVDPKEQTSFKLDFYFSPNEYFSNTVLTKTYCLERAEDDEEESVLTKTTGTTIDWKVNKNVTVKKITRKQRNKRTNQTRTVVETVEDNSFFNFFQSHIIPSDEQLELMGDREMTELEMIVEAEFEVGCVLRDKIVPRAVGWYLGVEKDDENESEGMSAGDVDDFEDDVRDDDDEDEDGDEIPDRVTTQTNEAGKEGCKQQ